MLILCVEECSIEFLLILFDDVLFVFLLLLKLLCIKIGLGDFMNVLLLYVVVIVGVKLILFMGMVIFGEIEDVLGVFVYGYGWVGDVFGVVVFCVVWCDLVVCG